MRLQSPYSFVLQLLLATASFAPESSGAADISALATSQCGACHGEQGRASNPQWPRLDGQKETYLARQLEAFRDGTRKDPLMSPAAAGLSDADIEALSAYYRQL
ncbi:MAG: c-type cytochrome [Panacagrimonas sp.]